MKREITGISLQRPYTDQILTPKDMFDCYSEKISGIDVYKRQEEENEDLFSSAIDVSDFSTKNFLGTEILYGCLLYTSRCV